MGIISNFFAKQMHSNTSLSNLMREALSFFEQHNLVSKVISLTKKERKRENFHTGKDEVFEDNLIFWINNELNGYNSGRSLTSLLHRVNHVDKYRYASCIGSHRLSFLSGEITLPLLDSVPEIENHIKANRSIEYINNDAPWITIFDSTPKFALYKIQFKLPNLSVTLDNILVEYKNRIKFVVNSLESDLSITLSSNKKYNIKTLIQEGKLKAALFSLKENDEIESDVLVLLSNLNSVESSFSANLIKREDYNIERSKIAKAIVDLINGLE